MTQPNEPKPCPFCNTVDCDAFQKQQRKLADLHEQFNARPQDTPEAEGLETCLVCDGTGTGGELGPLCGNCHGTGLFKPYPAPPEPAVSGGGAICTCGCPFAQHHDVEGGHSLWCDNCEDCYGFTPRPVDGGGMEERAVSFVASRGGYSTGGLVAFAQNEVEIATKAMGEENDRLLEALTWSVLWLSPRTKLKLLPRRWARRTTDC
jgi:hypothetical protein